MDPAAIIADLASAHFSLSEVAARHGLSLDDLAAFITSDQTRQRLDELQSAAAISTRFAAQLHLPIAVAALGTLLACHRPHACSSAPQATSTLSAEARSPSAEARSPSDDARSPRAEARALRHQVELRRAAATLLRCANFNPHARTNTQARASQPQHAIRPHDSAPHAHPQSVEDHPAPAAVAPSFNNTPAHPAAQAPSTPLSAPVSTPFTAQQSPPHFPSFAELFAAAVASIKSADDSAYGSPDDAGLFPGDADLCPDDADGCPNDADLCPDDADNADTQPSSPDSTASPPAVNAPATLAHTIRLHDSASHARQQSVDAQPAPVPSSAPFTSSSPAVSNLSTPHSPSSLAPSTTPYLAPPCTSHLDPFNSSSSSSPRFLRGSVTQWFVPSSSPVSHHRPSAAQRLTTSAGAPSRPP